MAVVFVVTILLVAGCINDLVKPVWAQDGCISHPLPPEVVEKLVAAANIALTQKNGSNCSCKEENAETVDGHALATLALLQHSLTATKEEFSASKKDWDNVSSLLSSTVNELAARKKDLENVSSLLSSTVNELSARKRDLENVQIEFTTMQSSVAAIQSELAVLHNSCGTGTSKSATCKNGWFLFQNSCYFLSTRKDTWEGGRRQCRNLGANYVKISTDAEFAFILSLIVDNTWIGLNDLQSEGTLSWISDGTVQEINFAWWHSDEPNNANNNEDCVHIRFDLGRKLFNDYFCSTGMLYICEMMPERTQI